MFDERIYIVNKWLGLPVYPGYEELFISNNKRMMHYWLKLNNFPHVKTEIFYEKDAFFKYIRDDAVFPLVIKPNVGYGAKGVQIIRSKAKAKQIARKIFGLIKPNRAKGYVAAKTGKMIHLPMRGARQAHYLITQKYEKIKWEWRMVKIGDSYFGHKKLLEQGFASGSKLKGWGLPPENLFYLTKQICDAGGFHSMNVDIFETEDGRFLVNELQSLFGQTTQHLMLVNDEPGRMVFKDNAFVFERGEFNQFKSYLLRVKDFVRLLENRN